jgi:16S rRNA G966 N2-methylase RsmD
MSENVLYYGDNLDILRRYIKDETVDLICLDPPFNGNVPYTWWPRTRRITGWQNGRRGA